MSWIWSETLKQEAKKRSKHPLTVEGWNGSLAQLAHNVGKARYDVVAEFLCELSKDIERQADLDFKKKRHKLASSLYMVSHSLEDSKQHMYAAWKICKPFMDCKTVKQKQEN